MPAGNRRYPAVLRVHSARTLAEMLGGRLDVSSTEGKGSTSPRRCDRSLAGVRWLDELHGGRPQKTDALHITSKGLNWSTKTSGCSSFPKVAMTSLSKPVDRTKLCRNVRAMGGAGVARFGRGGSPVVAHGTARTDDGDLKSALGPSAQQARTALWKHAQPGRTIDAKLRWHAMQLSSSGYRRWGKDARSRTGPRVAPDRASGQ